MKHKSKGKGPKFKRIVLKISGEAMQGQRKYGIDSAVVTSVSRQIKEVNSLVVEVAVVSFRILVISTVE